MSELSDELAVSYGKLVLLRGVGAISAQKFRACVGGASFKAERGINFSGVRKFQRDVLAGVHPGTNGRQVLDVLAGGPSGYQLLIHLRLDAPTPLGLHRLDLPPPLSQVGAPWLNQILLGNDDLFLSRESGMGLVLVTEYTTDRVEGAVLGLVLVNAVLNPTDVWMFGTFSGSPN